MSEALTVTLLLLLLMGVVALIIGWINLTVHFIDNLYVSIAVTLAPVLIALWFIFYFLLKAQ